MYSMLSTIVRNIEYNAPEYLVQYYTILGLFYRKCFSCLYYLFLLSLYHVVLENLNRRHVCDV